MATDSFNREAFFSSLREAVPTPTWDDADDLNLESIEAHMLSIATEKTRVTSRGSLRLTGEGVDGHTVPMTAAGEVLQDFQSLTTNLGASLEGNKSSKGPLPKTIRDRTALALSASPSQGSVVLKFKPQAQDGEQLSLDQMEDEPPLADKAIDTIFELFTNPPGDNDEDEDDWAARIHSYGPRVTNAVKIFSDRLSQNALDLDLKWRSSSGNSRRLEFSAARATGLSGHLDKVLTSNHSTAVSGVVLRVSITPSPALIISIGSYSSETPGIRKGAEIPVEVEDGDDHTFLDLRLNDRVLMELEVEESQLGKKPPSFNYILKHWLTESDFEQFSSTEGSAVT